MSSIVDRLFDLSVELLKNRQRKRRILLDKHIDPMMCVFHELHEKNARMLQDARETLRVDVDIKSVIRLILELESASMLAYGHRSRLLEAAISVQKNDTVLGLVYALYSYTSASRLVPKVDEVGPNSQGCEKEASSFLEQLRADQFVELARQNYMMMLACTLRSRSLKAESPRAVTINSRVDVDRTICILQEKHSSVMREYSKLRCELTGT